MSDKSCWKYQIVKYRDGSGFGLHEVFYDVDGKPWGRTVDPEGFWVDTTENADALRLMLIDAFFDVRHDVLDEPEIWPGKAPGESDDLEHDMKKDLHIVEGEEGP